MVVEMERAGLAAVWMPKAGKVIGRQRDGRVGCGRGRLRLPMRARRRV